LSESKIPADHPRAESLREREKLVEAYRNGVLTISGLIAHGRGETFDYLLGEKTNAAAEKSITAAAAMLLTAKYPVISVNGNTAALVPKDIVELAKVVNARIEVNLFYRSKKREFEIEKLLLSSGATDVLGVGENASARIPELGSDRRLVDPQGILVADVIIVPLEDGDRTEALKRMGKQVIAIDLNPLSRTAQNATITIVDNVVRCTPKLADAARKLKKRNIRELERIVHSFDNDKNLAECIRLIRDNLSNLARHHLRRLEKNK
jgi:4-phosphopantoate--beta-alanine ligase